MTLQKDNPDKRADAVEIAGFQSGYSAVDQRKYAVTVPEDKLAELQRKAKLVDELVEALELLIEDLALRAQLRGDDCLDVSDGRLYKAQKAIAKAKGE